MNTVELTVQRATADGWPVVIEETLSETISPLRHEAILRMQAGELSGFLERLRTSQSDPVLYGTELGKFLLQGEIGRLLDQARARGSDGTRVLLTIEADDLKQLYWQRLCVPIDGRWRPVALQQRLPFSLYLPSLADRRFPPFSRRDMRALLLVASPEGLDEYGMAAFNATDAVSAVGSAFGPIPFDVLGVDDEAVGPPTLDALAARLTARPYSVLHVVAHGHFAPLDNNSMIRDTHLYLSDANGRVDKVSGTRLITRLSSLRRLPHLGFLAACESAKPEAEARLGGLAQRLVRELGMPAVVAMTDQVSITTSHALAHEFYAGLAEHGEVDRALVEATAGLAERGDITVPALYSRLGNRPLFNTAPRPLHELTDDEIVDGLDRLSNLLQERAPSLIEEFSAENATVRGTLGVLPEHLTQTRRGERTQALEALNVLSNEVVELSFAALAQGQQPPSYDSRCPFRGLTPFGPEDHAFFFGRDALITTLRDRLADYPFLPVLGPSGSGKSSVVLAGLIPELKRAEPLLRWIYMTPGNDPVARLEGALDQSEEAPRLLVVDQFEELFTLNPERTRRQAFADRLLELAQTMRIVLTMRADFWGECASYPALKAAMQAHQELIGPMNQQELREAIDKQARSVGLRFEADLAAIILDEVSDEPGAMPLLQHALLELWQRRHGRWLKTEDYRALGGVRQAIAHTAEAQYQALSPAERGLMREIFLRLTRLDTETVRGEERRDTRQREGMAELVPPSADPGAIRGLLNRLADARLIVTGVDPATGREEVEVAHEALIRHWPRLQGWLSEDREFLLWRQSLQAAEDEWERSDRDDGSLLRGRRLEAALELRERHGDRLNAAEQLFLSASAQARARERDRARRRMRMTVAGLAGAFIAISAVAGIALVLRSQAVDASREAEARAGEAQAARATALAEQTEAESARQVAQSREAEARAARDEAQAREREAESRQVAATAMEQLSRDTEVSLLLALASLEIDDTNEAEQALRTALSQSLPFTPLAGHGDIISMSFNPKDERYVVAAGWENSARVWDWQDRRTVAELSHPEWVQAAEFSPDGNFVVTAGADDIARVWDWQSQQEVAELAHPGPVDSVNFSQDSSLIVTGSVRLVRVWDWQRKQVLAETSPGLVESVNFNRDGGLVVIGTETTARVWDWRAGAITKVLPHPDSVYTASFSPNGQFIVTGSGDGIARVWDWQPATPAVIANLPNPAGLLTAASFNADGRYVVTGGSDNKARIWEWQTSRLTDEILVDQVNAISFSPSGEYLATGGGTVARVWDLESGTSGVSIGDAETMVFSPDGRLVATAGGSEMVKVWDWDTGQVVAELQHPNEISDLSIPRWFNSIDFSSDGRLLVAGSPHGLALVWDWQANAVVAELVHSEAVWDVSFSHDSTLVVTGSSDRTARVWDWEREEPVAELVGEYVDDVVTDVGFSPDGRHVATSYLYTDPQIWDWKAERVVATLNQPHPTSMAYSPDGRYAATGAADGTVRIWDLESTQVARELEHPDSSRVLGFSIPDGQFLITASANDAVLVWDWQDEGAPSVPIVRLSESISDAAMSWNGKAVAIARSFGPASVYRCLACAPIDELVELARSRVTRDLTPQERRLYLPPSD